ncbi:MAG: N-methylhydantoinase [Chloroflexota bacterium]|nr:N-methylhydantoinase [Chloroflexota bacterium]
MTFSIGIDIGGTFTDCVVRAASGEVIFDKAFTTPADLAEGVVDAVTNAAARRGMTAESLLSQTAAFKIGTTSPVNRLINRKGARTGLLITVGHEDALLIGRVRQKTDGLAEGERSDIRAWRKAEPIIPSDLTRGVIERVDSFGDVVVPLDEASTRASARELVAAGCTAFAVCLLWSFLHPAHEQRVRAICLEEAPEAFVTISSDIAPLLGEYERCATTALNSYLGPGTAADLRSLDTRLKALGLKADVLLMQSTGGVVDAGFAQRRPVYMLSSGPVGGVAASRTMSERLDPSIHTQRNLIATDMGGTSFDVGVIADGKPIETPVSIHNRYRILVSAIEVISIGAGGGSIAAIEPVTGVLQVGPSSAGSVPGPVCYRLGGTEPTVTDANLVLGRLSPDRFFAGRHALDVEAARAAIASKLAAPLGVTVEQAAEATVRIVESRMADLIRRLTVERGFDPRSFSVVAYGGGGPLHAGAYAVDLGVPFVLVPVAASTFSAWGIAHSPIVHDAAISAPAILGEEGGPVRATFARLAEAKSAKSATSGNGGVSALYVDMRYRYQMHEVRVPVQASELGAPGLNRVLMDRFEQLYEQRFGAGTALRAAGVEVTTFRHITTVGFEWNESAPSLDGPPAGSATRRPVFLDGAWQNLPVIRLESIPATWAQAGPCMVEGDLMTIFVRDRQTIVRLPSGDFAITLDGGSPSGRSAAEDN